jgi:hypothetical protein
MVSNVLYIIISIWTSKAGPRHVATPVSLIIWCSFKPIFFKYLLLKVVFINKNLCFSSLYRFAPKAAAQIACPLIWHWTHLIRWHKLVQLSESSTEYCFIHISKKKNCGLRYNMNLTSPSHNPCDIPLTSCQASNTLLFQWQLMH